MRVSTLGNSLRVGRLGKSLGLRVFLGRLTRRVNCRSILADRLESRGLTAADGLG